MSSNFCSEAYVALATSDLTRLVKFYAALLLQTPEPLIPEKYAEFKLAGLKLSLFQPRGTHQTEFAQPTKSPLSLCLEVNDLDMAIAHFQAIGYPPSGDIIAASHGREIYAYDPDGNRLILHQRPAAQLSF
ncbi:MAG: VOC family protein [Leptolyngbyaceae cyanobacterium]